MSVRVWSWSRVREECICKVGRVDCVAGEDEVPPLSAVSRHTGFGAWCRVVVVAVGVGLQSRRCGVEGQHGFVVAAPPRPRAEL